MLPIRCSGHAFYYAIPKPGIPKPGMPKPGIPKPGMPKPGIPKGSVLVGTRPLGTRQGRRRGSPEVPGVPARCSRMPHARHPVLVQR